MEDLYRCPICKSNRINTLRMPTGPMWCMNCSFRVEEKENLRILFEYGEPKVKEDK